jgi:hypothetical protein
LNLKSPKYLTICIPAYLEPELIKTFESLTKANVEGLTVKVLALINNVEKAEESIDSQSVNYFKKAQEWINKYKGDIDFNVLLNQSLPQKHAGVGLARKILGDQAAADFVSKGVDGIIVYLDADCTVSESYFQAISRYFEDSNFNASAIRFEHHIIDEIKDKGILEYESHLRYYILMQRFLNLPFAIHTVGSSMAVMSDSYSSKGGMNKRKAGEDFYFLQKFIKDKECGNLTECCVYPSGRTSERVPFGTGRAMLNYENESDFTWQTYHPESFLILQPLIDNLEEIYTSEFDYNSLNTFLKAFLRSIEFDKNIKEIINNTANYTAFRKRFFQYFDAFRLMKYLHFMRDSAGKEDVPIGEALTWYFENVIKENQITNPIQSLKRLREIDNYGN